MPAIVAFRSEADIFSAAFTVPPLGKNPHPKSPDFGMWHGKAPELWRLTDPPPKA